MGVGAMTDQEKMDIEASAIVAQEKEFYELIDAPASSLSERAQLSIARRTWARRQPGKTIADAMIDLRDLFKNAPEGNYYIVMLDEAWARLRDSKAPVSPYKVKKMAQDMETLRSAKRKQEAHA